MQWTVSEARLMAKAMVRLYLAGRDFDLSTVVRDCMTVVAQQPPEARGVFWLTLATELNTPELELAFALLPSEKERVRAVA